MIKEKIAKLASDLFGKEITESYIGNRSKFIRGQGRIFEAYIVNDNYDDLISSGEIGSYNKSYETLLRKLQKELDNKAKQS